MPILLVVVREEARSGSLPPVAAAEAAAGEGRQQTERVMLGLLRFPEPLVLLSRAARGALALPLLPIMLVVREEARSGSLPPVAAA
jgi:hypothetical protein